MRFCDDIDILRYEPVLFGELHLPWQVLASGTNGELSGTALTATESDFISSQVCSGGVVYLRSEDGGVDGPFEVVSVDSATELTISVLRADGESSVVSPPSGSSLFYRISTLAPQASEASYRLMEYFGLRPANPDSELGVEDILDANVLRQACAFEVISSVYAMFASRAGEENFWKKSLHYGQLFAKSRERCRLSLDSGSDGAGDVTRRGGCSRLVRD